MIRRIRLYRLIATSHLFDHGYLREQRPGLPHSRWRCIWAYLRDPELWKLQPHPLFDGAAYLERSPDLLAQGVSPLAHYLGWGHLENRAPNSFFDSTFYVGQVSGGLKGLSPLEHYARYGARRGLKPCAHFDYDLYREIVNPKIPNAEVLSDLARYRHEPSRQVYVSTVIENALRACPRAAAQGSLVPTAGGTDLNTAGRTLCDVVIPVKNAIDWCERSYKALLQSDAIGKVSSIIFVDDGCSPVARCLLERCVTGEARAKIVATTGNHGFAAACNTGFNHTNSPYVLFLNSDCLLNRQTIDKMLGAFQHDPQIGLACAPANNAANVTLGLPAGESFISVEALLDHIYEERALAYPDICTTVGHCLMVSRTCYLEAAGMDESWGLGYGEESDLHLRARALGYRGVLVPNAYVYHFGGGTFRNEGDREQLQQHNHRRFMTLWGDSFASYHRLASLYDPVDQLHRDLQRLTADRSEECCDVLFVLPGITSGVGGIHVVLDLCNHLIQNGVHAKLVVMGQLNRDALKQYTEPLYTNPLHVENEDDLINNLGVKPKVVVSTLFSTVPAAWKLAKKYRAFLVNFIQGYEPYFQDGVHYETVVHSYLAADYSLTTSDWLWRKVVRKAPGKDVRQIPIGINTHLFFVEREAQEPPLKTRIGLVLRSSQDKGQFVLRELMDLLLEHKDSVALTVFKPSGHKLGSPWQQISDTEIVELPTGRDTLAKALRSVDIFVDASLHEGFGLFPLEAMACGAAVVASNSGGVLQYVRDGENGIIVREVNQPHVYLQAILGLVDNPSLLARLKGNATALAQGYDETECFDRYLDFFNQLLRGESDVTVGKRSEHEHARVDSELSHISEVGETFGQAAVRTEIQPHYYPVTEMLEQKVADIYELHLQMQQLTHEYQVTARDLCIRTEQFRMLEQALSARIIRKVRGLFRPRRS